MEKNQAPLSAGVPRRDFIKKAASAAAVVAATPVLRPTIYGQAPSANVTGANNKITVGVIGVGFGIGMNHFLGMREKAAENNIVVAAGCDVFKKRRAWMMGEAKVPYANNNQPISNPLKEADVYADHRKLLERKDIDAVLIATQDTWHKQITLDALQAGKHVYCEKPLTRYLDEAFTVYDAVKKAPKQVFQIGSQGCSAGGYKKCAELIKDGKIGTPVWAQAWYSRNSKKGEWNYTLEDESTAENIDWDRWQGPVKNRRAFDKEYFHRWRKYYEFCAGPLGDLAPHRLHPVMLATGNPQFPVRVCSLSTKPVGIDHDSSDKSPDRDTPEHAQLLAEFPGGFVILVTCCTVNGLSPGMSIFGHKATLNIDATGGKVELQVQREFGDDIDPETFSNMQPEEIRVHEKNWFDCIRSGTKPNADIELAIRVQTVISLAEMSDRLKTTCMFDEKTRKITDGSGKEIAPITYGTLPLS